MRIYLALSIVFSTLASYSIDAAPKTITFDGYATDTVINQQYYSSGILFGDKFIANVPNFPSNPVAAFTHPTLGPYFFTASFAFVTPISAYPNFLPRYVYSASFDVGPFAAPGDVTITWYKTISGATVVPIKTQLNTKAGVERISFSSSGGFNSIEIKSVEIHEPGTYPRLAIDNVTFDALGGSSCTTIASAVAPAAPCLCGDSDKDAIIAEYKKSYGMDSLGNPLRVFDLNLDPDGPKNGIKPSSYFVPTCEMFSNRLRTAHYTFDQIKNGTGNCQPKHTWALIATSLADTASSGRGLDRWAELIRADKFKYNGKTIVQTSYPRLTSAYRSPKRQLSACVGSEAYGSRHMFGDAVDLSVTGDDDAMRRAIALRWYQIGMMKAGVDWVESANNYPCTTKPSPGRRWPCAHGDWRKDSDRFTGSASSISMKPGAVAAAATLTQGEAISIPAVTDKDVERAQVLSLSRSWEDRAKAFEMLDLPAINTESDEALSAEASSTLSTKRREVLINILRGELAPNVNSGEEEGDFFYGVVMAAGTYAPRQAAPLLLSADVVSRGRAAWEAAARTGDTGAPMVIERLTVQDERYGDYLGVACMMLEKRTVHDEGNIAKLNIAMVKAADSQDWLYRSFAAECLKWTPEEIARPILTRLYARDTNDIVRDEAGKALKGLRTEGKRPE